MAETSRRDRKRAATQEALHAAALRLFAERGYAQTTVSDITEAVDVSERTFFRYFATKEDVLLHDLRQLRPELLDALAARPAGEPPLRAILSALREVAEKQQQGFRDGLTALVYRSAGGAGGSPTTRPALPRALRVFAEWEPGVVATLLARAGIDQPDEHDLLRAEVTARAAMAGLRTAVQTYRALAARGEAGKGTFMALAEEAFEVLERGCQ